MKFFSLAICAGLLGLAAFPASLLAQQKNGQGLPERMASGQGRQSGEGRHGKSRKTALFL
jgi:hypothetical protein